MKKWFWIVAYILILINLFTIHCLAQNILRSSATINEIDPSDLKLIKIEKVRGIPFAATIRNLSTMREYEYYKGDFIGQFEVFKITTMQVELKHKLLNQSYFLSLPSNVIEDKIETSFKDQAKILYDQAVTFYKLNETTKAIELLEKAINQKAGFEDALFLLGYIFHETGKYAKAYDYYQQVIVINPKNYKCLYNIAEIQAINGKINDAVLTLKKCLSIRADYQKAIVLLDKIQTEIEAKKKKQLELSKKAKISPQQIDELKQLLKEYAENIKKLEEELDMVKKKGGKTVMLEAEIARLKLLYDNNAKVLEELLKEK